MIPHDTASKPQTVISWVITESPSGEATLVVKINERVTYTVACKSNAMAKALLQKLLDVLSAAEHSRQLGTPG